MNEPDANIDVDLAAVRMRERLGCKREHALVHARVGVGGCTRTCL